MDVSPANPRAGEEVTLVLNGVDPDAPLFFLSSWHSGDPDQSHTIGDAAYARGYGHWTPPPRREGGYHRAFSWTYDEAGTYTASFELYSQSWRGDGCPGDPPYPGYCPTPYGNSARTAVTVTVRD